MSTSLNDNLATPPSTLVEDGQAVYEKQLRRALEPEHAGEFVAIEPSSGRYFLGKIATVALVAASSSMPKSHFFLTRVGRKAAHKLGGYGAII